MAFSRTRKRSSEQGKGFGKMGGEPASGLGGIVEIDLADEGENEILEGSHDDGRVAGGHASRIFVQGNIATIA
ncbi:MAG: hypothetical protein IT314_15800 [Anaerolineales bacterium]|nr:hypothetical protein [Anaerolineales bacterium]